MSLPVQHLVLYGAMFSGVLLGNLSPVVDLLTRSRKTEVVTHGERAPFPWLTLLVFAGLFIGLGWLVEARFLRQTQVSLSIRCLVVAFMSLLLAVASRSIVSEWRRGAGR